MNVDDHREAATVRVLRGFLLVLFLMGVLGIGVELLLLDHTEDLWQWTPLADGDQPGGARLAHR